MWEYTAHELSNSFDCTIASLPVMNNVGDIASDILSRIQGNFSVAGWSMGGYLALELMKRVPHRIERLALMSTSAHPEARDVALRRRIMIREARSKGYLNMIRQVTPRFLHPDTMDIGSVGQIMVEQAAEVGLEAFCCHQKALMTRPDYRALAATIQKPVVVMVGSGDIVTPVSGHEELAAMIPRAELIEIPDAGHMITLENPSATTSVLRTWLSDKDVAIAA
jgi:pimeloyl-ACP methyl ester carboxylesterase